MRTLLTAAALTLTATTADAQIACAHLSELIRYGADELGQVVQVRMEDANGADVMILADPEGNWSLIMAMGTQACVMAVGTDFEAATGL